MFATSATEQTVTNVGSVWYAINYTLAGSGFSVSRTAVALPTGAVSAMGLFADTKGLGTARFDNFTVTNIPEPFFLAALLGTGALSFTASRRPSRKA